MKLLYFIDGLQGGGKERRMIELIKYITTHQLAEVKIAIMSSEVSYPEIYKLGVTINYLIRKTKKDIRIFYQLYKLCKIFKPNVIHVWDSMTAIYAFPVARLLGIKLINGMITDAPKKISIRSSRWIRSKITFPFSDIIVANSLAGLDSYKAPRRKSLCIYNGFDWKRCNNLTERSIIRKIHKIDTQKVVGMVGEFADRKDYDCFIIAAQTVLSKRNDVTFITVGNGKNLDRCKARVHDKFRDKIKFLGWQSDVESIINTMDVGILTTNASVHGEGISNSVLEYMAIGKPVIATDSGGTKEILVDSVTGYLIQPGDTEQLVKYTIELLDNPELAITMGQKGRNRVSEIFSIETMTAQYLNLYRKHLKKE